MKKETMHNRIPTRKRRIETLQRMLDHKKERLTTTTGNSFLFAEVSALQWAIDEIEKIGTEI